MYKALKEVGFALPLYDEQGQLTGTYGNLLFLEPGQTYDLSQVDKAFLDNLVEEGFIEPVQA